MSVALSKIYTASERARISRRSAAKQPDAPNEEALARIEAASSALAESRDLWSSKRAIDGAQLLKQWARKTNCDDTVLSNAHALSIETRRNFGIHWREAEKNRGGYTDDVGPLDKPPTLSDLDVHPSVAAEAVKLADLADKHPDVYEQVKSGAKSKVSALRVLREPTEKEPETFNVIIASASAMRAIRDVFDEWPGEWRHRIPDLLRSLSSEIEAEIKC